VSGEGPGSQHPGYESTGGDHPVEHTVDRSVGESARTARRVFERVLDGLLEAFPEQATELGGGSKAAHSRPCLMLGCLI